MIDHNKEIQEPDQELEFHPVEILQEFHNCHHPQLTQLFATYTQAVQRRFDRIHVGRGDDHAHHPHHC